MSLTPLSRNATAKTWYLIEAYYVFNIKKNPDKELALYKEYAAKYPKEKEAHIRLGFMHYEPDPEKAIEEFHIVLRLDPNYGPPLNMLGFLHMKRKEFSKALEYWRRFTIAAPKNPNALDSLAFGYFRFGKVAEAKATLQKMHEKFPHVYMFDFLEYIDALEEDYEEALRWEERRLAVCTPQEKRVVYAQRGLFRGWLGDLDGSLSDIQRAEDMTEALGSKGQVAFYRGLRSWIYLDQHEPPSTRRPMPSSSSIRNTITGWACCMSKRA